jgi:hypothetical protein
MQPIQPTPTIDQQQLNLSYGQVFSGQVSFGKGLTFDVNKQPLTFNQDNMAGILIRIGANGNSLGTQYSWPGSNSNLTITHNLNIVPYGFIVVAKSKTCDVFWGSVLPTATQATIQCTDETADVTVFFMY